MAYSPQGSQHPQLPGYPQGPVPPDSIARPSWPAAMRRAVSLIYAGSAVGFIDAIVSSLTTHNVMFYTYSSKSPSTATVHHASSLVAGIISGLIAAGLWLWMAWKTGAGRNWARVLSSIFFGLLSLEFIAGLASLSGSGDTLPAFIVVLVEWGVGLAAIIQLWQRESSDFFALARQAKLAASFGAAYRGHQPSGYGQPPQYGPPGYGQPGDDQPPR
jgi:hypothetical protein